MELSNLATFAAVAKSGGITRAAAVLNTVQSNVTTRVKNLEQQLGVPLFERTRSGIQLTAAGKRLLPYADLLSNMTREAIAAARDDGIPKGPLSIGSMETTAAVRLPPILTHFHHRFPLVDLSLKTAPTAALIQDVLDGNLDGAFVAGPIQHASLVATRAFSEELVLITASRWKSLAALREAKNKAGLSILVFRTGCSYRQRFEQILQEMGWLCGARLEMGTLDGIMGCVAADMGATLLPRAVAERGNLNKGIRSHALKSEHRRVDTMFIRHARRHCSSSLEKLVECLETPAMSRSR